jgi:hypothetical protein
MTSRNRYHRTASLAALVLAASAASAQPSAAGPRSMFVERALTGRVPLGSRVRVESMVSTDAPVVGALRAFDDVSLTVETAEGQSVRANLADVRSVDVWTQPHRNIFKWTVLGAVGLTATAMLAANAFEKDEQGRAYGTAYSLIGGPIAGAAIGAITGATIKTGGWKRVPMAPVQHAAAAIGPSIDSSVQAELSSYAVAATAPSTARRLEWGVRPDFGRGAGVRFDLTW